MSSASVERVFPYLFIGYTNGNPIDLTLRIAAPQLEQGAFATSYIPTASAAATRAADSAVVTPISSFYNQAEGTLFAEGIAQNDVKLNPWVVSLQNAPATSFIGIRNRPSISEFNINTSTESPTAQAAISVGTTNNTRLIAAFKTDDAVFYANGSAGTPDTSLVMPNNIDRLLAGQAGSNYLNGTVAKIAYYPTRLSNNRLRALTQLILLCCITNITNFLLKETSLTSMNGLKG